MAESSTSVDVMFIAWWIVFAIMFWSLHMCEIEVVILFLILASNMTMIVLGFEIESLKILSSFFQWVVMASVSLQFTIVVATTSQDDQ